MTCLVSLHLAIGYDDVAKAAMGPEMWAHPLPYGSVRTIGDEWIPKERVKLRFQNRSWLSWRSTMFVCITLIAMLFCSNVAMAATATVDTVTVDANTVSTIKDFLNAITEARLEFNDFEEDVALQSVKFTYADANYKQVLLAGSFTGWVRIPMEKSGSRWTLTIAVPISQQFYRFSVTDENDSWDAIDPENTLATNHKDFGWVSILESEGWSEKEDTEARKVRKAKRQERRRHRQMIRSELERGQGITEDFSYQRVDGLVFNPALSHINKRGEYDISFRLHGNYGFSSGRLGGGLTILKPLFGPNLLNLKFSFFDRTMPNNDITGIGNVENSLAAFLLHEDYRDYHRSKGLNASLVMKVDNWFRLEGGVIKEEHFSLGRRSVWAVRDGDFQPNPLIDEGRMYSVFMNVGIGGRNSYALATYERSGANVIGGDFEFEKITAKLRGRLEFGRNSGLDARLTAGSNFRGTLPVQRRFLLGGLGTVRGYAYQSLLVEDSNQVPATGEHGLYGGERSVLGNIEYYFPLVNDFQMSVFYDAGMVWQDRHAEPSLDALKTSAGIGFNFDSDEGPRLELIQLLDGREDPYVVQFRLKRSF